MPKVDIETIIDHAAKARLKVIIKKIAEGQNVTSAELKELRSYQNKTGKKKTYRTMRLNTERSVGLRSGILAIFQNRKTSDVATMAKKISSII